MIRKRPYQAASGSRDRQGPQKPVSVQDLLATINRNKGHDDHHQSKKRMSKLLLPTCLGGLQNAFQPPIEHFKQPVGDQLTLAKAPPLLTFFCGSKYSLYLSTLYIYRVSRIRIHGSNDWRL